jgi:hypothetical protein
MRCATGIAILSSGEEVVFWTTSLLPSLSLTKVVVVFVVFVVLVAAPHASEVRSMRDSHLCVLV